MYLESVEPSEEDSLMSSAAYSVKRSVPAPVARRNRQLACRPTLLRVQISFQGPSADVSVGVIHIAVDNLLVLSYLQLLSAARRSDSRSLRGGGLYFFRRVVVNLFSSTRFFFRFAVFPFPVSCEGRRTLISVGAVVKDFLTTRLLFVSRRRCRRRGVK